MSKIGIIGSGSQADEMTSYIANHVDFFAVEKQYMNSGQVNVSFPSEQQTHVPVIGAVGPPGLRKRLIDQWPGNTYAQIIAKESVINERTIIGEGSMVAPGVIITTNVRIGNHTIINIGATISHDVNIGDFVTISPGVHIAGNVEINDGVFIGIGATISDRVKIARGSVIGAGAVVIRDVETENSVVVGVPAKIITQNNEWINEI